MTWRPHPPQHEGWISDAPASIAGLLLTTEAIVSEIPETEKEAPQMPGGGGMGGF